MAGEHQNQFETAPTATPRHRRRSDRRPFQLLVLLLLVISSATTDAFASILNRKPSLLKCVVNLQGGGSSGGEGVGQCADTSSATALQASTSAASSSSSTSMSLKIREVKTSPIPGMKPGTSGLRKKVEVWQGEHYVENFIQALIDTATARSPNQKVPDTYVFL